MKTSDSRSLSDFRSVSKWKMWSAKRLGITVEEFDQRIEEKKQEYARQKEARTAERIKKSSESKRRGRYEDAVFNGRFAGTFEEYKCKYFRRSLPRRRRLSEEDKKMYRRNWSRKRGYAAAVEKGKFSGTFEEYCQHFDYLEQVRKMAPEEQAQAHRTFSRKRTYAAAVEKGKFSGNFEEYCQHLDRVRGGERTPEEKAEAHRIVSRNYVRRRAYGKLVEKGKFIGTFEEYCQYLDRVHSKTITPEEKEKYRPAIRQNSCYLKCNERKYQRLVQAGYEVGTFEEFNHILEEASRLNKMLREVKKAEKAA